MEINECSTSCADTEAAAEVIIKAESDKRLNILTVFIGFNNSVKFV